MRMFNFLSGLLGGGSHSEEKMTEQPAPQDVPEVVAAAAPATPIGAPPPPPPAAVEVPPPAIDPTAPRKRERAIVVGTTPEETAAAQAAQDSVDFGDGPLDSASGLRLVASEDEIDVAEPVDSIAPPLPAAPVPANVLNLPVSGNVGDLIAAARQKRQQQATDAGVVAQLQQQLEEERSARAEVERQRDEFRDDSTAHAARCVELEQERDGLAASLTEANADRDRLGQELTATSDRVERFRDALDAANGNTTTSNQRLGQLQTIIDNLQANLAQVSSDRDQLIDFVQREL